MYIGLTSAVSIINSFKPHVMKQSPAIISAALSSYQRKVKRLKNCSPEWKPISLKEYIQGYHKKARYRNSHS